MRTLSLIVLVLGTPTLALAHTGAGDHGAFASGLAHPLFGADHLLAMLAVGLWAALSGGRALWAYPAAFMVAMLAGGVLGAGGVALPVIEPAILASVVLAGAAAALALNVSLSVALAGLVLFGAAHGYAHGFEGPGGGGYAAGVLLATAALHALGIALARLGMTTARLIGGGVALAGVALALV